MGKMAAAAANIMMPPQQSPIGKGEGKAVGHGACRQVEQRLDYPAQLQPATIHGLD